MKRIILGLSLLLMLVQNGFALDLNAQWSKQVIKCENQLNLEAKANIDECSQAITILEKSSKLSKDQKKYLAESYMNKGVLYYFKSDFVNSYKYLMIGAKKGNLKAQSNLDILCNQHSWVCK